jgi:hypothetical protein
MLFAIAAPVFWFFFLVACPVLTFASIAAASLGARTMPQAILLNILLLPALTVALGPALTDAGPMAWWLTNFKLATRSNVQYFVWQYALVCLAVQAVLLLLRALLFARD